MEPNAHEFLRRSTTAIVALAALAMVLIPPAAGDAGTDDAPPAPWGDDAAAGPELPPPGNVDRTDTGAGPSTARRSGLAVTNVDEDLVIDEDTLLHDGIWLVNGSVCVSGATLTLENVDLTFQNLSLRSFVSFEVEPGGALICRNSTVTGRALSISMLLEGENEVVDSTLIADPLSGGQGYVISIGGNITLLDSTVDRFDVQSNNNVTVRGCHFWNYTRALNIFYGWPVKGVTYNALVEGSTFHDAGSGASGVVMGGPGQLNNACHIAVRNCTFENVSKAIDLCMFHHNGGISLENNNISGSVNGINMMSVGPMVVCCNNTIDASIGIVLVNQERMMPSIHDETVRATQYGLRLSVPLEVWSIDGLDVQADITISSTGSHLTVTNSSLGTTGTLQVTDGTMTLVNCSHGRRGQVSGEGSWICEFVPMTFNTSRWACGPAIEGGLLEILDELGTKLAVKPHAVVLALRVVHWQVTADGTSSFDKAHGSFWLEDWEFTTATFDIAKDAFVEMVFWDDLAPNVTIDSPSEGELVKGGSVVLEGRFLEVGAGVVAIRARVDEGSWVDVSPDDVSCWNVTLDVPTDGGHVLTVAVEDLAGNTGIASVGVTTDDSGPPIEVLEPAPWVNEPNVDLVVKTEPGALAFVNDEEVSVNADGIFRRSLDLGGGVEAVHIRVVDKAGNWNETMYSIELDQTPPIIAINEPTDDGWSGSTVVHVSGLVEEGATTLVNGLEPELDGLAWWIDLTAGEGNLDIEVTAEDRAGNVATAGILVHIDLTPPSLQVTSPGDGSLVNASSIDVTGWTTDLGPVTVLVNGRSAAMDGHDWHYLLDLEEGSTELTVIARDAAGNERSCTLEVLCDRCAPSVNASLQVGDDRHGPGTPLLIDRTDVTVVVQVDEPCVLTIAGWGSHDLTTGENSVDIDLVADRVNVLVLTVVDLAGNGIPPTSFNVTTDLVPPSLEVLEPTPGGVVHSPALTLKGMTEVDADLTIEGEACTVKPDGSFTYELELDEGANQIVLRVEDRAGNAATLTVDITYEREEPAGEVDDGFGWQLAIVGVVLVSLAVVAVVVLWSRERAS